MHRPDVPVCLVSRDTRVKAARWMTPALANKYVGASFLMMAAVVSLGMLQQMWPRKGFLRLTEICPSS